MGLASVAAVSAHTAIGLSALQTALCLRANKREPRASHVRDKRQQAVGCCRVGGLGRDTHGYARLLALAAGALRDLLGDVSGELAHITSSSALPLVVALPEPGRPDDDERYANGFVSDVGARSGARLDVKTSAVVRAGHAGGALALARACELLAGGAPAVLVGGVDSYVHPDVLAWLDDQCRLHAIGAEDGIVPGEASAFCLLVAKGCDVLVTDVESGRDDCLESGVPDVAGPMTGLLQKLAQRHGPSVWTMSDDNGEDHRQRWWRLESARGTVESDAPHTRLPRGLGDVGAATGAVAMAVATHLWRLGAAPEPSCVVTLHSEGPERGAFRMEHAPTGSAEVA